MSGLSFSFATAGRILFGNGVSASLGAEAAAIGTRVLLVRGRSRLRIQPLASQLETLAATELLELEVTGEPTVDVMRAACARLAGSRIEVVVGIGGGSVMDAAKAMGALLANPGDPLDYLEIVGRNQPLTVPPIPVIAVPTTAGTGSEVTRNAVLTVPDKRVKVSLRHPLLYPRLAVIDPLLTHSLPPLETALSGLDALTQVIEPYLSCQANPVTDALCAEAIRRGARALPRAFHHGQDAEARTDMAFTSLVGGIALANAGLGAVHGFAGPIGGMFAAPHGGICAALLPHVFAANITAVRQRRPDSPTLGKMAAVAAFLTGRPNATPEEGTEFLKTLVDELQVPPLGRYGVTADHIHDIVPRAQAASSMKGNPLPLDDRELETILRSAC